MTEAETIYGLAQTSNVGQLTTTVPYDYYGETEWRDDMELGGAELALAVGMAANNGDAPAGLPQTDPAYYLRQAAHWASAYIHGPGDGADSLNLYDVSGLAHYELYQAITQFGDPGGLEASQSDLLSDLRAQLDTAVTQAHSDPFGLGYQYTQGDVVPHALGLALTAIFYDDLTHSQTYHAFADAQRDWTLGANAWGTSFIVGAGDVFPGCLHSQIANLAGWLPAASAKAQAPILLGATVDGPQTANQLQGLSLPDGARACPTSTHDPYHTFGGHGVVYADNAADYPCVEPADDYTALTILLLARQLAAPA